jgi:hypothetical protein
VHKSAVNLGIGRKRADTLADAIWGALDRHQRNEARQRSEGSEQEPPAAEKQNS